jgi:hypothetical protein
MIRTSSQGSIRTLKPVKEVKEVGGKESIFEQRAKKLPDKYISTKDQLTNLVKTCIKYDLKDEEQTTAKLGKEIK